MSEQTTSHCPECGAALSGTTTCKDLLNAVHVWEFENPDLHALHFLIVASYNLQHPSQFSTEAVKALQILFKNAVDLGLPNAEVRERANYLLAIFEGSKKVLNEEKERVLEPKTWDMTIADVSIPHESQHAIERVKAWATSIRKELA